MAKQLFRVTLAEDRNAGLWILRANRSQDWRCEDDVPNVPRLEYQNPPDRTWLLSAQRQKPSQRPAQCVYEAEKSDLAARDSPCLCHR